MSVTLSLCWKENLLLLHSRTDFSINIVHEPSQTFIRCHPCIDKCDTLFLLRTKDVNKNKSLINNKGVRIQTFTLSPFMAYLYPRTGRLFSCFICVYTAYYKKNSIPVVWLQTNFYALTLDKRVHFREVFLLFFSHRSFTMIAGLV